MAVLVECLTLIVPVSVLEARFPGGLAGYAQAVPNGTFCHDGVLTRVAFQTPDQVDAWLELLLRHGWTVLEHDRWVDAAVVDQAHGLTSSCDWLAFGQCFEQGIAFVAAPHEDPVRCTVVAPPGWTGGGADEAFAIPADEVADRMEWIGEQDGLLAFRDRLTGRVGYIPRGCRIPGWTERET